MTTLVQTIPSCEIVIVLCVTLKSRACISTLSNLKNQRIRIQSSPKLSLSAKRHLHSNNVANEEVFVDEECVEVDEEQQLQSCGEEGG